MKNASEVYQCPEAERVDCADATMAYKMIIFLILKIKLQWVVAVVLLENLSVTFTIPGLGKL